MKNLLKLEELSLLGLALFLFSGLDYGWGWYALLFLTPDLSMFGYLANPRLGAWTYNLIHHKGLAVVLYVLGSLLSIPWLMFAGTLLLGHSSFDRVFGYGLKHEDAFQNTHLREDWEVNINMSNNETVSIENAWTVWTDCLKGDDTNSIFQQIYVMIWDAAIFRFILESRQTQIAKHPVNPPLNVNFHSFLDRNFFQTQAVSIRRLADKSRYGLMGRKGIYSLYSLIDDIAKRRTELTRENFFELRCIPYDYTHLQQGEKEFITQQIKENNSAFRIPPEFNWEASANAHITFDRLCGVQTQDRTPQDIISEKVFSRLKERLDLCSDVTNYVDKYIAHSATPESRIIENVDSARITLKHVWDAHQTIYEGAEFLSFVLFSEGHVPLIWKSPTLFDNWGAPLLESEDINQLEIVYKEYGKETTKWQLEGVNNIWRWIESHDS